LNESHISSWMSMSFDDCQSDDFRRSTFCFQVLSTSINRLIQHRELLLLLNPVEKLSLVFSQWQLIWIIQLVQSDPEIFVKITYPQKPHLEQDWDNLISLILDLRKLVLDQTEAGLIEAMLLTNGGKTLLKDV
jgi:hypothetical protein